MSIALACVVRSRTVIVNRFLRIVLRKSLLGPPPLFPHMTRIQVQPTSLLVHLFGTDGKEVLSFEDFHKFMENLQTEVLELEFNEFSRGYSTISEEDFARILLRYT